MEEPNAFEQVKGRTYEDLSGDENPVAEQNMGRKVEEEGLDPE
jgi:hypothetical protein